MTGWTGDARIHSARKRNDAARPEVSSSRSAEPSARAHEAHPNPCEHSGREGDAELLCEPGDESVTSRGSSP